MFEVLLLPAATTTLSCSVPVICAIVGGTCASVSVSGRSCGVGGNPFQRGGHGTVIIQWDATHITTTVTTTTTTSTTHTIYGKIAEDIERINTIIEGDVKDQLDSIPILASAVELVQNEVENNQRSVEDLNNRTSSTLAVATAIATSTANLSARVAVNEVAIAEAYRQVGALQQDAANDLVARMDVLYSQLQVDAKLSALRDEFDANHTSEVDAKVAALRAEFETKFETLLAEKVAAECLIDDSRRHQRDVAKCVTLFKQIGNVVDTGNGNASIIRSDTTTTQSDTAGASGEDTDSSLVLFFAAGAGVFLLILGIVVGVVVSRGSNSSTRNAESTFQNPMFAGVHGRTAENPLYSDVPAAAPLSIAGADSGYLQISDSIN